VLELHVQPGARRTGAAGLHGGRLKVRVAARAVEDAANAALIEFLADALGAARRDVTIQAGRSSRAKRVCVHGARRSPLSLLRNGGGT
jgi:uncharacterized protein (TIGR00251 family)